MSPSGCNLACCTRNGINPRQPSPITFPNRKLTALRLVCRAQSPQASSAIALDIPYAPTGLTFVQPGPTLALPPLPYTALDESKIKISGRSDDRLFTVP